jgi:hypothetical protein
MVNAVRFQPLEEGIALPRLDDLGDRAGPGSIPSPNDAEAEEHGQRREPQVRPAVEEVLDRREDSVARTTLPLRRPEERESTVDDSRVTGEDTAALDHRLAMLVRYSLGREVGVPARMRPPHVVEHQQRDVASRRPFVDQAQLLAHRVVVVIAVDDHGVRKRDVAKRIVARLTDQLQLGASLAELDQLGLRSRVDRHDAPARALRPVEQQARQVPRVRAHLRDRSRPARAQTGNQDLPDVDQ